MKRIFSIFSVVLATVAMTPSCTNLESEMYDVINPGIFPVNGDDANYFGSLFSFPFELV